MKFYVKRLFSDNKIQHIHYKKNLYINSNNEYVRNKFISTLSKKIYNNKTNFIYVHDKFKTNFINSIKIPDLNLSINGVNSKNFDIDLNSILKPNKEEYIISQKQNIKYLKKCFLNKIDEIYKIFKEISIQSQKFINEDSLLKFRNEFISSVFKTIDTDNSKNNFEFTISSVGINGFKTFSSNIPSNENKLFILNDSFDLFKNYFIDELIKKSNELNLNYELYKNHLDNSKVSHIRIPSINLCVISNNILFNEKIPGVQINEDRFVKDFNDKNIIKLKNELSNLIHELNLICKDLNKNYTELNLFFDKLISTDEFNKLINKAIKNVIP